MLSVEESNAALEKEFAQQSSQAADPPPSQGESEASDELLQSGSAAAEKTEEIISDGAAVGSDGRPLLDPKGSYLPDNSHETDKNASKFLIKTSRDSDKRTENPSFLLLEDLRGLGMYGELSEDQGHVTMPFQDVHRLVTTMRMAEVILNERIQNRRKAKLDLLTAQLNAGDCENTSALLIQLERAKAALAQKYSFQSVGMFGDEPVIDLEGVVYFETLLLARSIDWLARLSINPDSETRRARLQSLQNSKPPILPRVLFMSFTFISTMTRSFLKREFVVPCLTWGSDSPELQLPPRPVQLLSGITSPLNCRAFPLS